MRRTHHLVILALLAGGLAACADRPGGAEAEAPVLPPAADAPPKEVDPTALIGIFTLANAGDDSGRIVRLAADAGQAPGGDLRLWRPCGSLMGSWRADAAGLFTGGVYGASGCSLTAESAPDWLAQAASMTVDGDAVILLDAQQRPVARLNPGGKPPTDPNLAASEAQPPKLTDEGRRAFVPAAPLPAGLTAADRAAVTGKWLPVEATGGSDPAYAEFLDDGSWRGSDGCNGQGGRWTSGSQGAFLATTGPSTLIACDNVPIAAWINDARRAGLDGETLVLFDVNGKELGRLKPAK